MSNTTPPIALVTGAGCGIGRGISYRLIEAGYIVWALDQNPDALADLAAQLSSPTSQGGNEQTRQLVTWQADVADEAEVERCLSALSEAHGRLDLLVNNAGLSGPYNGPIETLALADWQRVIDVNLTGMFLTAKHSTTLLRASQGAIINLTSTRATQSEPQSEAYAASKGGIQALTHALAVSLGPDIRVNAIAPGWIDVRALQPGGTAIEPLRELDHSQHPVGRVGKVDDIAELVLFLASEKAGFITGQTLTADGGMTIKMIYEH